jgi:hypothetical protein
MTKRNVALDAAKPSTKLWIGNISESISEVKLREMLIPFGQVQEIRLKYEKFCAIVRFSDIKEATLARQELQGKYIADKNLKINFLFEDPSTTKKKKKKKKKKQNSSQITFSTEQITSVGLLSAVLNEKSVLDLPSRDLDEKVEASVEYGDQQNNLQTEPINERPKKKKKKELPQKPTEVCRFFRMSACKKGVECPFSHEGVVPKVEQVCKFFKTGSCRKGTDCAFSHDLSIEPCKYFVTLGTCTNADCPYGHFLPAPSENNSGQEEPIIEKKSNQSNPFLSSSLASSEEPNEGFDKIGNSEKNTEYRSSTPRNLKNVSQSHPTRAEESNNNFFEGGYLAPCYELIPETPPTFLKKNNSISAEIMTPNYLSNNFGNYNSVSFS